MPRNNETPTEVYTSPATTNTNRSLALLLALAALLVVIISSGCASTNVEDNDPYRYNPNTGYPFIGGPFDHPRP
jgi:hypothetical protein